MVFDKELNLYKFDYYCGRMGDLEGLFFAKEKSIESLIGQYIHFGEVLGKHSDISVTIEEKHLSKIDISLSSVGSRERHNHLA